MTNILIVDDQDDIRAGIRAMLLLDPGLVVVGDLSDHFDAVEFVAVGRRREEHRRTGVLTVDHRHGDSNGIAEVRFADAVSDIY